MHFMQKMSLVLLIIGLSMHTTHASYELFDAILGNGESYTDEQVQQIAQLIDQGADVNSPLFAGGFTPLHIAVSHFFVPGKESDMSNGIAIINLLVSRGANINSRIGNFGNTPLGLALENNAPYSLIKKLFSLKTSTEMLTRIQLRKLLDMQRIEQQKALRIANQNLKVMKFPEGTTLLHKAVSIKLSTVRSIKKILETGVDVNAIDSMGNTALHLAIQNNLLDIATLLINNAALDTTLVNNDGKIALQLARTSEMNALVRSLMPGNESLQTDFEHEQEQQIHAQERINNQQVQIIEMIREARLEQARQLRAQQAEQEQDRINYLNYEDFV